jgi:hypothetical protein
VATKPKKSTKPKRSTKPAERTPAELLDLADGPSVTARIAEAMRTGNGALVAQTRKDLGR